MGDKPRTELLTGLRSLYQSRDFSDLVLYARDGSAHAVHRAVVCPRSEYFYNAVKDEQWREGEQGHIELPDEEPEILRLLVEYLYILDYEPISAVNNEDVSSHGDSSDTMSIRTEAGHYGHVYGTSAISAFGGPQSPFSNVFRSRTESQLTVHALPGTEFHGTFGRSDNQRRKPSRGPPESSPLATADPNLVLHASMYATGHKYGIDGLKALALDKFKIQLTAHWDAHEMAEAIHVVYNSTPSSEKDMREAVADTISWHSRLLDKPEVECAILEINGLAYELLKRSRRAEPEFMN